MSSWSDKGFKNFLPWFQICKYFLVILFLLHIYICFIYFVTMLLVHTNLWLYMIFFLDYYIVSPSFLFHILFFKYPSNIFSLKFIRSIDFFILMFVLFISICFSFRSTYSLFYYWFFASCFLFFFLMESLSSFTSLNIISTCVFNSLSNGFIKLILSKENHVLTAEVVFVLLS